MHAGFAHRAAFKKQRKRASERSPKVDIAPVQRFLLFSPRLDFRRVESSRVDRTGRGRAARTSERPTVRKCILHRSAFNGVMAWPCVMRAGTWGGERKETKRNETKRDETRSGGNAMSRVPRARVPRSRVSRILHAILGPGGRLNVSSHENLASLPPDFSHLHF